MRNNDTIVPDINAGIRWTARVTATILAILVLIAFFSSEKQLNLNNAKISDSVLTISLIVAVAGLLIGWVSEGLGGGLTVIGLATFFIVNYYSGGDFPIEILVLAIPAILYLVYWWRIY